jgi:S1-C subfamily serine protease
MSGTRLTLLVAGALVTAAVGGCADRGQDENARTTTVRTQTVERTKVEVVEQPSKAPFFDPSAIYHRVSPGVVTVVSTGFSGQSGGGVGSGFVIDASGEVATNAHVVTTGEGSKIKKAGEVYVSFEDGNEVPAQIVGFDPFSDVALLRIDPAGLRLRPIELGSTEGIQVGAPVAAIGSPFGEDRSLSNGIVSALGRSIDSLTGFATPGAIQTDAAINQGNSGGPLLDARGRVIGINSQIQTRSGDSTGVGFAVPVDTVRRSLAQLRRGGRAHYAYLGVSTSPVFPQLAKRFDLAVRSGAWVQTITKGGPADSAGLRAGSGSTRFQARPYANGGDVIVSLAGQPVNDEEALAALVAARRPGERVKVTVVRGKDRRNLTVTLGERPVGDLPAR